MLGDRPRLPDVRSESQPRGISQLDFSVRNLVDRVKVHFTDIGRWGRYRLRPQQNDSNDFTPIRMQCAHCARNFSSFLVRTRSTSSSAAVSQSICRIIVLGIPQHPAVSAKVFSSPNLLHDFSGGKRPPVESIISESLQPWPEADRRQRAPFLGPCKRTIDDFIGMRYGIGASRNPEVKAGWVEHGREIIEMRSDSFQCLTDPCIVEVPTHIAKEIC